MHREQILTEINKLRRQLLEYDLAEEVKDADRDKALKSAKLTKEQIIAEAMTLPDIPRRLLKLLDDNGFTTGSSVFGDPKLANDVDWVINVPPKVFRGYILGASLAYFNENRFVTGYGHVGETLYNIICMSDRNLFKAWFFATTVMQAIRALQVSCTPHGYREVIQPMDQLYNNKYARVRVFRALVDAFDTVQVDIPAIPTSYINQLAENALQWKRCKRCGREAINFTTLAHCHHWETTGICERCTMRTTKA